MPTLRTAKMYRDAARSGFGAMFAPTGDGHQDAVKRHALRLFREGRENHISEHYGGCVISLIARSNT